MNVEGNDPAGDLVEAGELNDGVESVGDTADGKITSAAASSAAAAIRGSGIRKSIKVRDSGQLWRQIARRLRRRDPVRAALGSV
jgi:hypothetical protein